jgi:hypothetical protein
MSFATMTLYVASKRGFTFVCVYFVIDSVRKLLDTPSYSQDNAEDISTNEAIW